MRVQFDDDRIRFLGYPFRQSTAFQRGSVLLADIRDVDPDASPPELRTRAGETLFVSAEQEDEFRRAIESARLPVVRRVDIWSLLLEPFFDTEFAEADQRRTLDRLENLGFPAAEVETIRKRVGPTMMRWNAFQWEWVHLGLCDLLEAYRKRISWDSLSQLVVPGRATRFYWHAMAIADRGHFDAGATARFIVARMWREQGRGRQSEAQQGLPSGTEATAVRT